MAGTATITMGSTQWQVSVATTPSELATGLGGLSSIPAGTGMLFVFGATQEVTVTTEPMLFDLDILFLDVNLQVIGVHRDIPPGRQITAICRYFLEVNAGEAVNVNVGDQAQVSELPPTDSSNIIGQVLPAMVMMMIVVGMMGAFSTIGEAS